jgi:UDP:flavonoid glycosyltransferase YjiC (YdhE family)
VNRWRKKELAIQKSPFWKPTAQDAVHHLVAFSPVLIPRPSDWDCRIQMTSFCRLQEGRSWVPSPELQNFLGQGEPPVYIGFGSLTDSFSPAVVAMLVEVLKKRKTKAIISGNLPGLESLQLPSHIFLSQYIPHDWLFPKVTAVVHHGGIGTLAAGLYAGKPTLVIPCIVDQFYFGRKVKEWGVGPAPLPREKFREDLFDARLEQLLTERSYQQKAEEIQALLLQEEDGAQATCKKIYESLSKIKTR